VADTTRKSATATQAKAMQLVAWLGATWIDSLSLDESNKIRAALASILEVQADVHRETARKHIAKAMRRQRHPDWQPPAWGGPRPGAGRPRAEEIEEAMRAADRLTNYGQNDPTEAD
jgi:hypothetical protein